jgi:ubiquitin conjugation factor E4 B
VNLVGPKLQDLRVSNPDKFQFKPKRLLAGIGQIYLNLGREPEFIRAVANDGRSYSKELFERFARILKNRAIMTDPEVAELVAFAAKVVDMSATIAIEDEREIPDEFLDPLLSTRESKRDLADVSDERSRHLTNVPSRHRQEHDQDGSPVERAGSV